MSERVHGPADTGITEASPLQGVEPVQPSAVAAGITIGVLLGVLNTLVLFRTGTAFGGSAIVALLGAAVLRLFGAVRWQALFVVFSIASSGYFATAAIDSAAAAVVIGGHQLPPWPILLSLALAANLLGVALGVLVGQRFLGDPQLTYPTLRPATQLLSLLTRSERRVARPLLLSVGAAATVTTVAGATVGETVPLWPGSPAFAALSLSPLLLGVGLLVGGRLVPWLTAGAAYSALAWSWRPSDSYGSHLGSPWILPAAMGLMAGVALTGLVRDRRQVLDGLTTLRTGGAGRGARIAQVVTVVTVVGGAVALVRLAGPVRGLVIASASTVLLAFAVVFMNRAGGEVGIVPLAPVVYSGVLVMVAAGTGAAWSLLAAATIAGTGVSCVYLVYARRIGGTAPDGAPPSLRRITLTQVVGGVTGSVAGVAFIVLAARGGLLGTPSLPVPTANALGLLSSGLVDLGRTGLAALAAGAAVGAGAVMLHVAPTSMGLGILLPPSATAVVIAGCLGREAVRRWRTAWNEHLDVVASGLIIGEGVVTVAVLATRAWLGAS